MKRVKPIPDYCIGCGLCELACLQAHSRSGDLVIACRQEAPQGLTSCKTVHRRGPAAVALSCQHCQDPECVRACISGALYKDAGTGQTVYDQDKCVGCFSCVMVCPFGAIHRHPTESRIVKCDLCADRGSPACVEVCPNAALVFEED
ncbi:4Fe-4S dicluster domain-containing protein [Desulfohalovibrio reitneri]|uniref:4Fe-4S dicluster domain-containing protein n=1 Tax=Desulfohalovibrio reitneri TaxID=1307759 RepID=UPI0004A6B667|nr:4Fe-4S dicluster domain-containing protein [Desulfohalovibrio reitneri]